jgi:hypothetical protein
VPNPDTSAHVPWNTSTCAKATGDADSPGQLSAPAPVPGREQTRNRISSRVSVAPEELLHAKEARPTEMQAQLGHSDIRTTLDIIYTQITDPDVARMVNQVTNRILGLDGEVEPGSVQ